MNKSGARGARWERRLADRLKVTFRFADRRVKTGALDKGDIGGVPGWVIEAKDWQRFDPAIWIDQAEKERINAGEPYTVVCFPRKNHSIEKSYALMEFQQLEALMVGTGELERLELEVDQLHAAIQDLQDEVNSLEDENRVFRARAISSLKVESWPKPFRVDL